MKNAARRWPPSNRPADRDRAGEAGSHPLNYQSRLGVSNGD